MSDLPRPKKAFGQNFLSDPAILRRIAEAARLKPDDHVLEVGPGRGALTRILAAEAEKVLAVEVDLELIPILNAEFSLSGNVSIVSGDILQLDLQELLPVDALHKWKVVANLPYYISTPVLFRFLECRHLFSRLVLMLQREVGERLAALPGSKTYGALSVLCQRYFAIRSEFIIRPGAFFPRPKVDSVVVSFEPLPLELPDVGDEDLFRHVVKGSFAQRRKTISNSLRAAGRFSPAAIDAALHGADIAGSRRAETLSVAEFEKLSFLIATAVS